MAAELTIMGKFRAGPWQAYPVVSVWVDGDIVDQVDLAVLRKRIAWLPLWVPFNSWVDASFAAQKAVIERVKEQCALMFGEVTCTFEASR